MKISYVVNARIPTEKAHGYQIMRVCSELTRLGHDVALYVPTRSNPIKEDAFTYYTLPQTFSIVRVSCIDLMPFAWLLGGLAFKVTGASFLRSLNIPAGSIVYTRDADAVEYLSTKGFKAFYNAHNWEESRKARVQYAKGIVCNSGGTQKAVAELGLPTIVAPNATDANQFVGQSKTSLREELGLPGGSIALYAGHVYNWKGGEVLKKAAALVPHVTFAILGESGEAQGNLKFLGHKPHAEVAKYLVAADALLLPNIYEGESRYTSPLKMFEYMASGTPIVASNLPAIREVLDHETAILVKPGVPEALAEGVATALTNGQTVAHNALTLSAQYSWSSHAKKVAEFFETYSKRL